MTIFFLANPIPRRQRPRDLARAWPLAIALIILIGSNGCGTIASRPPTPSEFVSLEGPPEHPVGRELDMVSLPAYTIEPPDVLTIEALRIVPKSPFRIRPLDTLQIDVEGTSLDQPIRGPHLVEPGGTVNLGPGYGRVKVSNLSLEEARDAVELHLRRTLRDPQVSITLSESAGLQQVTGQHIVSPDGYVNLGTYGQVFVTGLTVEGARAAIEEHLAKYLEEPKVSVDVFSFNSKVYYVVTEGGGNGDNINRFPVTGNETVLTAITQVNGLSQLSSKNIWIARPAPDGAACDQILPVKWNDIVRGADTSTNYQVLPGDRIFIESDHWIAANTTLNKITAPFERVLGFVLLGANTTQTLQRFPGGLQGTGFGNQGF